METIRQDCIINRIEVNGNLSIETDKGLYLIQIMLEKGFYKIRIQRHELKNSKMITKYIDCKKMNTKQIQDKVRSFKNQLIFNNTVLPLFN
ncbi:MAG: hypothetical protein ACM3O3_13075 [Syntrophothermus sp.]